MIEETIGGSPAAAALSAIITNGDLVAVCNMLVDKSSVSLKTTECMLGWAEDKAKNVLNTLFSKGVLGAVGPDGLRFSVNKDALFAFLDEAESSNAGTPKIDDKPDTPEGIIAGKLEGAIVPDAPETAEVAVIHAKFAHQPQAIKETKHRKSLDELLAFASTLPKKQFLEGQDRELAIADAFGRMADAIEKFNKGLETLDGVSFIKFSRTPASIVRDATGWTVKYREGLKGGVNRRGFWESELSQKWLDAKVKKVEDWTASMFSIELKKAQRAAAQ